MPSDEKEINKALSAFRKRLRAFQLEQDSKLTRNHVTGKKETITAIQPPLGFGKAIWEELVTLGHLTYEGHGLYSMAEKKP